MAAVFPLIGIVGAGAMGRGIAQIAAQAGSQVLLFDTHADASAAAQESVYLQWDKLHDKGRFDTAQKILYRSRLQCSNSLAGLAKCDLLIEAIVERLDAKAELFAELEALIAPGAVLASNTSSLSITAMGARLKRPQRLAGFHFFNPVPLMKVVEVIAGLKTEPGVCEALVRYARQ